MTEQNTICLKLYVTAELYMGLKHRASGLDRTLSQHLRHLIRLDLLQACAEECLGGRGMGGPEEGHEDGR
jgi:hypothetical protein